MTEYAGAQKGTDASSRLPLAEAVHHFSPEVLLTAASDPALSEDLALILLKRNDLPSLVLERLSQNSGLTKSRELKVALVEHLKTPRHVSLPIVRHLFTFDLMKIGLKPATPADVKAAAHEALIKRLETISLGERLSLARQASGAVAGALLLDKEARVVEAALENPQLTETLIVKAILQPNSSEALVEAVCHHHKWSLRREIRMAMLRHEQAGPVRAAVIARELPAAIVHEVLQNARLPEDVRLVLERRLEEDSALEISESTSNEE